MKIIISSIVAVNPHVLRVSLYTYHPENDDQPSNNYELDIPIDSFTNTGADGNMEVDITKFQEVVTGRVAEIQNMANLATAIDILELEWEVIVQPPVTSEIDGKLLAYGEVNENT